MTPRAPTPWRLWPALATAVAVGALAMQLLGQTAVRSPPSTPPVPSVVAPLAPAAAKGPAVRPVSMPALLAVVTVDGVPSLALVGGESPRLLRAGDLMPGGAAVLAVETRALVLREDGRVRRLELTGPVVTLASAPPASAPPAMPPPGFGAMPMPPTPDDRVGSGNAAFRAAVEEKARSMRK